MENEVTTVNDIVEKAAEANNSKTDTGTNSQEQNNKTDEAQKTAEAEKLKLDAEALAAKEKETPTAPDALAELLKETGFANLEDLKQKLAKKEDEVLSEEDKAKREELKKADVQKYAVENGMKIDDIHQIETLKKTADADLVYKAWVEDWKKENEDDAAEDNWEELAKKDFETEYKLNSENEAAKKRGEAKLAKEANEIRKPLTDKYESVKSEFERESKMRQAYPDFAKKVETFVSESIPEKYDFFKGKDGETEIEISIDLTADDKKEIATAVAKKVQSPETWSKYEKGSLDDIKTIAKTETDKFIDDKYREQGKTELAQKFSEAGFKRGSIGAKNPFPLKAGETAADSSGRSAQQEVIDSLEGKK